MTALLLRLSALGDVIHTLPAALALRDADRAAPLAWAVESPYAELVERVTGIPAIAVDTKRWRRAPFSAATRGAMRAARRELRDFARGATSVDFQGLVKSASLGWLAGAGVRYGFAPDAIRERGASLFINRPIAVDTSLHVVEQNLALARAAGATAARPPQPDFAPFLAEPTDALRPLFGRTLLLPATGRASKNWPHFAALAPRLDDPLVVWGPGERALAEAIPAELAPPTTLRELALLLANARLVIGGDTGPLHLAAALGTPVIGLFGPTNPDRNGPYGQRDRCLSSWTTTRAVDSIAVSDVMRKISEVSG